MGTARGRQEWRDRWWSPLQGPRSRRVVVKARAGPWWAPSGGCPSPLWDDGVGRAEESQPGCRAVVRGARVGTRGESRRVPERAVSGCVRPVGLRRRTRRRLRPPAGPSRPVTTPRLLPPRWSTIAACPSARPRIARAPAIRADDPDGAPRRASAAAHGMAAVQAAVTRPVAHGDGAAHVAWWSVLLTFRERLAQRG